MPSKRSGPRATDYVIADLHLGHKNVINMPGRHIKVYQLCSEGRPIPDLGHTVSLFSTPEQHDSYVIQKINETVPADGHLWILGDVAFNKSGLERVREINCAKSVVMGNHDKEAVSIYADLFECVGGAVKGTVEDVDIIMTHIPVHECQKGRFGLNVHGHLHTEWIDDDFYSLVSCEHIDFIPLQLRDAVRYNGMF